MTGELNIICSELIAKLGAHRFLIECRNGTVSRQTMYIFLSQHAIYSRHFTRLLCALMSNLQNNAQVYALANNLFEELGFDNSGALPHSVLFQNMLEAFEIRTPSEDEALPGTRQLIDRMYRECRDGDVARGLGALWLGAEALVPAMYSAIIHGLRALGHTEADCTFFQLHIECDDGHAETIEQILEDLIASDASRIVSVVDAGRLAVDARMAFFDNIHTVAAKKLEEIN